MANEKKKQISTDKKKTTQPKNKQAALENQSKKPKNEIGKKATKKKSETKQKVEVKKAPITVETNEKKNIKNKNATKLQVSKTVSNSKDTKKKNIETVSDHRMRNEKIGSSVMANSDEMGKLVKIILVLIIIVTIFYGLTVLITKFQKTKVPDRNQNITPAVIQYDEILIGTLLNQRRNEYYVLIQKDDDMNQTLTSYYLQRYAASSKSLKVYMSNMNSIYNQFYVAETSNLKTNNITEFRVSTVTLVKVENHEIVEAYEGIEEIEKAFKNLLSQK